MNTTAPNIRPASGGAPSAGVVSSGGSGSSGSGGTSGGGGPSGAGGSTGPCGACKFLRRKCVAGCIFAPYFDSEQGAAHFAAVHKVFGASNVSKLLIHIPAHRRLDAVVTICYEAQARLRDPVYGCVAHIFTLQQQVVNLQAELAYLQAHLSSLEVPTPPPPPPQPLMVPPLLSISDLPSASSMPAATYDLSSLFDPLAQQQQQQQPPPQQPLPPTWPIMQPRPYPSRPIDPCPFGGEREAPPYGSTSTAGGGGRGGGDLQALARELLQRHRSTSSTVPGTEPSHSSSMSK